MKGHQVLVVALLVGCAPAIDPTVMEEIRGRWTTTDDRYANRYFEITPEDGLLIGLGPDSASENVIEEVQVATEGENRQGYELIYVDTEGEESVFRFSYVRGEDVIRITNQKDIAWTRSTPSSDA